MKRVPFLLSLALLAAPATAQDANDFASGCADDSGGDRCSAEAIQAWQKLYDLLPIEKMAQDGATVRRALYVDGYGGNRLAISAIRAKGAPPMIEIRAPRREGKPAVTRNAAISEAEWDRVLADSEIAHRRYADEPKAENGEINICLHGWVTRAESADPRRLSPNVVGQEWLAAASRGTTGGACAGDPTFKFSWDLADAAVRSFPECAALGLEGERNNVTLLQTCLRFSGDMIAAGHARHAMRELMRELAQRDSMAGWSDDLKKSERFASEAFRTGKHVDWVALETGFGEAKDVHFYIDAIHGIDSQHVRQALTANWYPHDDGDERSEKARRIEIDWIEQAGSWMIEDIRFLD
jgi:hypothetical protein